MSCKHGSTYSDSQNLQGVSRNENCLPVTVKYSHKMEKYMRRSALNLDSVHAAKYLFPGKVMPEHFEQLMLLSKIRGKKINAALKDFLVNGKNRKEIFFIYGISPGYFSHKLNQLRRCSRMIMNLLPYYVCDDADNIKNERIH